MQSSSARQCEPLAVYSLYSLSAPLLPARSFVSAQTAGGAKRTLTKARIEEAVGGAFIITTLALTGSFYYLLYQAVRA
jgi:hypothetical protein